MSDSRDREGLSNGFLPQTVLLHPDPTAIGIVDLEAEPQVRRPTAAPEGARDQLLLMRLHKQPVGIVHLELPVGAESPSALLDLAWDRAAPEITAHSTRYGCLRVPGNAQELRESLQAADGACPCETPQRPPGRAAVILSTVGRESVLSRCLESLARLKCEDFEVIVVDNRPSVPGTKALADQYAAQLDLRYVPEPRPGLSLARNTGVAATDAAYVAFVDDDVMVDEDWLARLLEPFGDPKVQVVTGLVLPLSLATPVQKRFEQYAGFGKGVVGAFYDMDEHRADDRFLYPYFGGVFGSGNSMAFRKDALLAVGGFDAALGTGTPTGGGEDIAAFTDVILRGGRLAYEPRAMCWHEHRGDETALEAQVRGSGIGLTAVFWRFLWRDWRFAATILKSMPLTLRLVAKRRQHRGAAVVPVDLLRQEAKARWSGPWRYMVSSRRAQRSSR